MSAPTVDREGTTSKQPLPSVFAVRAEVAEVADVRFFDREIDAAIEHAASTGSFDELKGALYTWLGMALQAKNAGAHARLPIEQRGESLQGLVREWVAAHPEAVH